MAKFKSTSKSNKLKVLGLAVALPLCAAGMGNLLTNKVSRALEYNVGYSQEITINNGSFQNGGGEYSGPSNSLSGWEAIDKNSNARGMIINVGANFNDNRAYYKLNNNPRDTGENDDRILMINSRNDEDDENKRMQQGYKLSNDITLEPNSYYRLTVDAKASLDGRADGAYSAYASIYLDGLKDAEGKEVPVYYEEIDDSSWKNYYFFVATGTQSQTVNIGLYLGSKTSNSTGVVFFDEVTLTRFAENTFYETIYEPNYGYKDVDVTSGENYIDVTGEDSVLKNRRVNTRFVIDSLKENDTAVVDTSDLNFDFETLKGTNALGDKWSTVYKSRNAHAQILRVDGTDKDAFNNTTGYDFVGADLTYNNDKTENKENQNALVLFNDDSAYVTVQSKELLLPAHSIYRISLRAKISSLEGNFKVGVVETKNESFGLPSNYTLKTFSKNGFTENGDTDDAKCHNGYTNVDLYVKGHDLYDTQFAIQLSLGTQDEMAKGCVLFDNITVTRVDYATYSQASSSDKTEFKVESESPAFTNGAFDFAQNADATVVYPLAAQNFTSSKTQYAESGIIFVPYDEESYDNLYKPQYDEDGTLVKGYEWYFSTPLHPKGYTKTNNNVYMMYNPLLTQQTLTTPTFSAGSDITQVSFDLKTISTSSKQAQIAVEITDENGIVLFYKDGIEAKDWKNMKFYIQGGQSISSTLSLKIHFGQQKTEFYNQNLMKGYVLLDNFETNTLTTLPNGISADVDLSDLYLNLDPYGKVGYNVTDSTAFTFESTSLESSTAGTTALGGVVSGQENEYNVESKNNILVLSAIGPSKNTLTSKFKFTLEGSIESPSYYKLTFDLRTGFGYDTLEDSDKHKCTSGVSVGLDGFEKATTLRSDDDFTSYTIFFKSTASTSPALVFSLDADCDETCGNAYLSNFAFATATEDEYTVAQGHKDDEEKTIFTSTATAQDTEDNEETTSPEENTEGMNPEELWIIIPSLIMALTVVVAIVGFALRRVKFKKIEKARRESYDRVAHVNHDLMLKRAQDQRDQEAEEIRTALQEIANERAALESEHKEAVKASRSAGGKVTKSTERAFKAYAQAIARLGEKEEILREQLENTMSADYLISVEKRLADEEQKKLKEMAKQKPLKEDAEAEKENKK